MTHLREDSVNLLYPPFAEKVRRAIINAKANKIPVEVFETFRSWERQNHLYAKGRTAAGPIRTNRTGGWSWHNYGIAVDIVMRVDNRYNWDELHLYKDVSVFFEEQGLAWAGRSGFELVHYELPCEFFVRDALNIVKEHSILNFWSRLNNQYEKDY